MTAHNAKRFALFHIASAALEEVLLVSVLLALLPRFGIRTPLWLVALLALAWASWSYLSYKFISKTMRKPPVVGPETLVGLRCRTTTELSPGGYVRAGSELWRARSLADRIEAEAEVVVAEVSGLTLLVVPAADPITEG